MERDFAAYLFTLFCPLFTSGASFSIAHEYSVRKVNALTLLKDIQTVHKLPSQSYVTLSDCARVE